MRQLIKAHLGLLLTGAMTFVMMGAGQALLGPALPVFGRAFALETGAGALLISAFWIGCFLGVGYMFFRGAKIGPRPVLAVMALGSQMMGLGPGWGAVLLGSAVFGLGYGMATVVFNPGVMRTFGRYGPSMLSLLNATFGIGAIAAPLIFVGLGQDRVWSFGLLAGLAAVILVFATDAGQPPTQVEGPSRKFQPHWGILVFGLIAIGLEASLAGLGPTALIRAGVPETRAAELLSAYFVIFLLARIALIFVAHRVQPFLLYLGAVSWGALCAVGMVFLPPDWFFVAIGVSAGLFFPGYYITASSKMGDDRRVPASIVAAGLVGAIAMPALLAPMMAKLGDRGFFELIAGLLVALTIASLFARRGMRV